MAMLRAEKQRSSAARDGGPATDSQRVACAGQLTGAPVSAWPSTEKARESGEDARVSLSLAHLARVSGAPGAGTPASCLYAPEAVGEAGEAALLDAVRRERGRWVELRGRRLQQYGGSPRAVSDGGGCEGAEALPTWLQSLADCLVATAVFPAGARPNHALINEYGLDEGILPHTDGPAYFPLVATLSLGSPALMRFSRAGEAPLDLRLERRSLVVTGEELYSHWLHSIPCDAHAGEGGALLLGLGFAPGPVARTGTRLSITLRHVPPGAGGADPGEGV